MEYIPTCNSLYGTNNCPLRKKLRFAQNRHATFQGLSDIPDKHKLTLATLGFFFSGVRYVFCVWCWKKFAATSEEPIRHPNFCSKRNIAHQSDVNSGAIESRLCLNLTENPQGQATGALAALDTLPYPQEFKQACRDKIESCGYGDTLICDLGFELTSVVRAFSDQWRDSGVGFTDINEAIEKIVEEDEATADLRQGRLSNMGTSIRTDSETLLKTTDDERPPTKLSTAYISQSDTSKTGSLLKESLALTEGSLPSSEWERFISDNTDGQYIEASVTLNNSGMPECPPIISKRGKSMLNAYPTEDHLPNMPAMNRGPKLAFSGNMSTETSGVDYDSSSQETTSEFGDTRYRHNRKPSSGNLKRQPEQDTQRDHQPQGNTQLPRGISTGTTDSESQDKHDLDRLANSMTAIQCILRFKNCLTNHFHFQVRNFRDVGMIIALLAAFVVAYISITKVNSSKHQD